MGAVSSMSIVLVGNPCGSVNFIHLYDTKRCEHVLGSHPGATYLALWLNQVNLYLQKEIRSFSNSRFGTQSRSRCCLISGIEMTCGVSIEVATLLLVDWYVEAK